MQPNSTRTRDRAIRQHTLADRGRDGGTPIGGREGVHVTHENGTRDLEAMAGMWSASPGFGEHRLAEAAYRPVTFLSCYHTLHVRAPMPDVGPAGDECRDVVRIVRQSLDGVWAEIRHDRVAAAE